MTVAERNDNIHRRSAATVILGPGELGVREADQTSNQLPEFVYEGFDDRTQMLPTPRPDRLIRRVARQGTSTAAPSNRPWARSDSARSAWSSGYRWVDTTSRCCCARARNSRA